MGLLTQELTRNFMLVNVNPLALASPNVDWASNRDWSPHNVLYRRFSPSPFNAELSLSLFLPLDIFIAWRIALLSRYIHYLGTLSFSLGGCTAVPMCRRERRGGDLSPMWVSRGLHNLSFNLGVYKPVNSGLRICRFRVIFLPVQVNHAFHQISGSQDKSVGRLTRLTLG